jgi:hypothetical protein
MPMYQLPRGAAHTLTDEQADGKTENEYRVSHVLLAKTRGVRNFAGTGWRRHVVWGLGLARGYALCWLAQGCLVR